MYGNITSHLYVFKRGLFIMEIQQQLFKGQRTLWPGSPHHLGQAVVRGGQIGVPPQGASKDVGGSAGTGWAVLPGIFIGQRGLESLPTIVPSSRWDPSQGLAWAPLQWLSSICPPNLSAKQAGLGCLHLSLPAAGNELEDHKRLTDRATFPRRAIPASASPSMLGRQNMTSASPCGNRS
jgi:hypothetical protein